MKRRSIASRLIGAILAVLVLAFLFYSAYSAYYFSSVLTRQVIENASQSLKQTSDHVKYLQEDVRQFASHILIDESVKKHLTGSNGAPSVVEYYEVAGILVQYMTMKDYVVRISVVSNGNTVFSSQRSYDPEISLMDGWWNDFRERGVSMGFSNRHFININRGREQDVITYVSPFYSFNNHNQKIGDLYIDIDYLYFYHTIAAAVSQFEWFLWLSGDGAVMYSQGNGWQSFMPLPAADRQEDGAAMLVSSVDMNDGWTFWAVPRQNDIRSATSFVVSFFLLLATVVIFVICLILMPIILRLIKPIYQLTQAAQSISGGELDVRVSVKTRDEMQTLSEAFNLMTQNLSLQMKQIVENEKVKNNLKMEMLISQINPHFIYNTLNSVIYLALEGKNQDVAELTRIFIRILEDNLKLGLEGAFGSIREEIACVKDYLALQAFRYPDRFSLRLDVDESLWEEPVPRLLLQPLVENALFHGILPQEEHGIITVQIHRRNDVMEVIVEDNGVGIDESKCRELLETPSNIGSAMRSIGIANVRERLDLYYGGMCEFSMDSLAESGTIIRISLPL